MDTFIHKIYFSLLVLLIGCKSVKTQTLIDDNPDFAISINAKNIEVDKLQNIYLVTTENEILRYSSTLKLLYQYSNDRLGDITSLDVSNPHKILVFYQDYGIVKSLDNTLTETHQIDLNELNLWDISAVALSLDNFIWLYDPIEFKIKKINNFGNVLLESYNLMDELSQTIDPAMIKEKNNELFILDQKNVIYKFDNLANYQKSYTLNIDKNFVKFISQENLIFKQEKQIVKYNLNSGDNSSIEMYELKPDELVDMEFQQNLMYLLFEQGLLITNLN